MFCSTIQRAVGWCNAVEDWFEARLGAERWKLVATFVDDRQGSACYMVTVNLREEVRKNQHPELVL
ncbi:hypothetical protein I6N90_19675 [Paenibacillus sp. GSMTC-2017]|nr:hypothetical protein [Paenibacillus sp. GSMTC-2017]